MAVTVTPRPWMQAVTGGCPGTAVARGIRDEGTVHLAPGAEQHVTATLESAAAGVKYGALEAVGVPTDAATRTGVVLGYRLVGPLPDLPPAPNAAITQPEGRQGNRRAAGQEDGQHDRPRHRQCRGQDARGTRNLTVQAVKILSGKDGQHPARQQAHQGFGDGEGDAQPAQQAGAAIHQEVQGEVK